VFRVAHFTDYGTTLNRDSAHFAGSQPDCCMCTFTRHQLHRAPGASGQLCTFAGLEFDAVNRRADRNITQWQTISILDWCINSGLQDVAGLDTLWRDDVPPFTVTVKYQRNMCGTIRIVFNTLHFPSNSILVAFKVNNPVTSFVTAPLMTHGNSSVVIASRTPLPLLNQWAVRITLMQ
jgi:hypothetical protein